MYALSDESASSSAELAECEAAEVWEYIKKNKLNEGRIIKPDAKLKLVFPVASPLAPFECMRCRLVRHNREFVVHVHVAEARPAEGREFHEIDSIEARVHEMNATKGSRSCWLEEMLSVQNF